MNVSVVNIDAGFHLGSYEVVAPLGQGGMGEVWRARDSTLGREIALKVLPAEMAEDPERLRRFQREARLLASLNHPNIVTIHTVEDSDGISFLTMELIEGQPLERLIPDRGFPIEELLAISVPLVEAIAVAHEKGIVHRDLKPANVMMNGDGHVKVLDFGLAKISDSDPELDETISRELTRQGTVMGTLPYMSPEQVAGRAVDHRSDIFSLGVMLFEMATGKRPFGGDTAAELSAAILRDRPGSVSSHGCDLPHELDRIIESALAKDPNARYQSSRDLHADLLGLPLQSSSPTTSPAGPAAAAEATDSGPVRAEDGFWVAVLPFGVRGADSELESLAEGLCEDIVTGLSRFSYLKVIARSSTARFAKGAGDVRAIGAALGASYVMEGSIRQAAATVRIAARLVDTGSGATLWAQTYNRPFRPDGIFELLDDVVPRIVSTVADMHGVLPHSMSEALRGRDPDGLTPYEAVLRSFGYVERLTAEEHAEVRTCLERATEGSPNDADCLAMLSFVYAEEHKHGFNVRPDPLGRALDAARRAVAAAPSGHLGYHVLAQALFFRRELQAFRNAAERAVELNPMDGCTTAFMGILMAYAGDWKQGCELAERAMELNPHHPGWYRFASFNNAYRTGDYRGALDVALEFNMPSYFYTHMALAAAHGQLGDHEAAGRAVDELLAYKPGFASEVRQELGKWYGEGELLESVLDGLRNAGLDVPVPSGDAAPRSDSTADGVSIAVLPFADMSAAKDQDYLCEGMAEEIMNALVRVEGMRVASRTSAFRARQDGMDLPAIARALSVGHVLEGSVRTSDSRLRVTAQLTEVSTGFQLWSERYDREAQDLFALQDEIAAGVVEAVKSRLAPGERRLPVRPRLENLDAYRHYLQGRHLRYTMNDHGAALQSFEQAVALDPCHAPSWIGIAEVNVLVSLYGLISAPEAYASAKEALSIAARLQGENADALYVAGMVAYGERDWSATERALSRAVEIEPDHVRARCWYGQLLTVLGRPQAGRAELARARESDPLAPFPYAMTGHCLVSEGRAAEAERFLDQALTFESGNTLALWVAGLNMVTLGRPDEGIALLRRADSPAHREGLIHGALGWALAVAGRVDEARRILHELRSRPAASPTVISEAWLLAELGEVGEAWKILHQGEREGQIVLTFAGLPGFDPLRADPRFDELLDRLGLPAPH